MSARVRSPVLRALSVALGLAIVTLAGAWGCGRSNLDDYLVRDGGAEGSVDGGDARPPEAGACNATTCPTGCCDATGTCQTGASITQCGALGEACQSCKAEGFQFCDPTRHACGNQVGTCNATDCSGCCEGNVCFAGGDPNECGGAGRTCQHCQSAGLACSGQQCVQQACGPQTCKGCCFGDQCLAGTDQTACGVAGQQCANCAAGSQTCVSTGGIGGTCQGQPTCSPTTCKGCCLGNACAPGSSNAACGVGGQQCVDCASANESCQGQTCISVPPVCNAKSCPGCCDLAGACQPGFVDGQCGQGGVSCEDCSALNPPSTCDVNVTPRTCISQQTQCPAPYPACPTGLQTAVPTQELVCTPSDLQNVASACAAGAHSAGCQSFFSFEQSQNPKCAACLGTFDYNFQELTGLFECVAPFVDATCNHDTACIVDCTDSSCAQCPGAGATAQCKNQVRSGQCASYYQGAQCIGQAFAGPGSFCNPNQYQGNVGSWLAGVGKYYCGQ